MLTQIEDTAELLKALGEPTRMRLVALCRHGECSVSELTRVVAESQPRVSQHLKRLCEAGILRRFRDGKWVFYRVAGRRSGERSAMRRLLALIPDDDPLLKKDLARLQALRGEKLAVDDGGNVRQGDRPLFKALVEQTVTAQLGDLLDIGCGRGQVLKLLASRANRAVGVDIDSDARRMTRAELMLAGLPNCSLRGGDMYQLPFADAEFDSIVLDDVLADARRPVNALTEARRLLKPGGRLFVLLQVERRSPPELQTLLAGWSAEAGLRLAAPILAPKNDPKWLLAIATAADSRDAAA